MICCDTSGYHFCQYCPELLPLRAGLVHRLRGVIVAVDKPLFVFLVLARPDQIVQPVLHVLGLVVAAQHQAHHARRRRGPLLAAVRLVREAREALVVFLRAAAFDVGHGAVNRLFGHRNPGVLGRAQGQKLDHGHGQVVIHDARLVAPAAFLVLRAHDQLDGVLQLVVDALVAGLAPGLGQAHRRQAVVVHHVAVFVPLEEQAGGLGAVEEIIQALGHLLAIRPFAGQVARGHPGQQPRRDDGRTSAPCCRRTSRRPAAASPDTAAPSGSKPCPRASTRLRPRCRPSRAAERRPTRPRSIPDEMDS